MDIPFALLSFGEVCPSVCSAEGKEERSLAQPKHVLTEWDVAKIVLALLGALAGIAALLHKL